MALGIAGAPGLPLPPPPGLERPWDFEGYFGPPPGLSLGFVPELSDFEERPHGDFDDQRGSQPGLPDLWTVLRREGFLEAQSLLRLRRSIDEIYLLCEFESDETLSEGVQKILLSAAEDFGSLRKQLQSQQAYTSQGEFPSKAGVAWTTRNCRGGESMAEHFEKVQQGSPVNAAGKGGYKERFSPPPRKRKTSMESRGRTPCSETGEAESSQSEFTPLSPSLEDRPDLRDEAGAVCDRTADRSKSGSKDRGSHNYQSTVENVHLLHNRLGRARKPSPEEVKTRHEARQRKAEHRRAQQDEERQSQLRQAENRAAAARGRRQEQEMRRQRELLEKMTRAWGQYQDQLRLVYERARKENLRAQEVADLAKEALRTEREVQTKKQENARNSREVMLDQMRQKLIESAERVAKVSEKRKQQVETWQEKVQQELEEKERLASERRQERMNSIKLRSSVHETRSEIVQRKRRELQEFDERSTQDFLRFRSKNIGKMALDSDGLPEGVKEEVDAPSATLLTRPRRKTKGEATISTPSKGCRSGDSPSAAMLSAAAECSDSAQDETCSPPRSQAPANAAAATELRRRLNAKALTEEEALQLASASDGPKAAAGNAAQRAKISKLAADLAKVLGVSSAAAAASSEDQFHSLGYLNLEKAESVLNEFSKVLTQVQREADVALILKLNCARMVVDLCCRVKDNIASFEVAGDKASVVAWKQNCNVQLCALKWLGLLCKSRLARLVLLLTGRVTLLADVATAYLDMHFAEALKPQDVEGGPVLFLPQLLHVLALHMKQAPPEGARELQGSLAAYLILCGLAEKLRELFGRAEIRLKLFDGASPLPLLLLRAMCFLHILVTAYRRPGGAQPEANSSPEVVAAIAASHERVLETLRNTELFGVVGILVSILLSEGRREKGAKLPQTVVSLCVQALRILNCVAQIDLKTLQKTMGAGAGRQQELYHVLVTLLDYCVARIPGSVTKPTTSQGQPEESELLHETVVLLGFYCLEAPQNQTILCYGEGQVLLCRLAALPLHYFMEERGKSILFPTILASCYESEQNLDVLRSEMNLSLLKNFLNAQIAQGEEARSPDGLPPFSCRFPPALWQAAVAFFDGTPKEEHSAEEIGVNA